MSTPAPAPAAAPAAPPGRAAPARDLPALPADALEAILRTAFAEDAPYGDVTSQVLLPATARAEAFLVAREAGIFSGGEVFAAAMLRQDPHALVRLDAADGDSFAAGDVLARVQGNARAVLSAERIALNLCQRMSAIATTTARYVALASGTRARVVDTRKTTPGLRILERHAVRCGGGHNHRFSLSDAVLAKDNHLAVLTGGDETRLGPALAGVRAALPHTTHFEVEVDRISQIEPVLTAGVDTIMLDNFTLEQLREGVALVAGRALVEASGNVSLDTVAAIAGTGVDIISVGALTHSVRALDLGLDMSIAATGPAVAAGPAAGAGAGPAGGARP